MAEWLWPNGTKTEPKVASPYGYRIHPVYGTKIMHYGTDFVGLTINYSVTDGVVTHVGVVPGWTGGGYGVWVKNSDGSLAKYFHGVAGSAYVKVGDKVTAGQKLSRTGMTGTATGVHLHLEISPKPGGANNQTDPVPYIKARLADTAGDGGAVVVPTTPTEEEDEDMAKMKGAYYTSGETTVYMLFNEESGFVVEHSVVPASYNNTIAKNWETNSWSPITEAHATGIKNALAKVRTNSA